MSEQIIEVGKGAFDNARGRNGWFKPKTVRLFNRPDGNIELNVESGRHGDLEPIFLSLAPDELKVVARAILGVFDENAALVDDAVNVLDHEGIDTDKVFKDHPELKELLFLFDYDSTGYNEALSEFLHTKASELGIELTDYETKEGEL